VILPSEGSDNGRRILGTRTYCHINHKIILATSLTPRNYEPMIYLNKLVPPDSQLIVSGVFCLFRLLCL